MLFSKSNINKYIKTIIESIQPYYDSAESFKYLQKFSDIEDELKICKDFLNEEQNNYRLFICFFDFMGTYLFNRFEKPNERPFCQIRAANHYMIPQPLLTVPFEKWSDIYYKYISYLKTQEDFVNVDERDGYRQIQNEMSNRIKELSNEYEQLYYYLIDPMAHK